MLSHLRAAFFMRMAEVTHESRYQTGPATLHVQKKTPAIAKPTGTGTPVARPRNNSRRRSELWPSIRRARSISRKEQGSHCPTCAASILAWPPIRKGSLALALHCKPMVSSFPGWLCSQVWPGGIASARLELARCVAVTGKWRSTSCGAELGIASS